MKLNFKSFGEGPNLIILHGLLGSLDNWQTLAKRFSEDIKVYTVDQRNHGQSPHSVEMDYDVLSQDLFDFIQENEIKDPVLLGHSMGGKTVMKFALDHSELLKGLIIADMSPKPFGLHLQYILDALSTVDFNKVRSRKEVVSILMGEIKNMGIVQFLAKNVYWVEKEKLAYRFNLEVLNNSVSEISDWQESGIYTGETLFIRGGNSNYITDDEVNIDRQFPNAEIKTIDGAGHWLHAEKPDDFYAIVKDFILSL